MQTDGPVSIQLIPYLPGEKVEKKEKRNVGKEEREKGR